MFIDFDIRVYVDVYCRCLYRCLSAWWYTYPSEKYEFVSWDDKTTQLNGKKTKPVPKHQIVIVDITS